MYKTLNLLIIVLVISGCVESKSPIVKLRQVDSKKICTNCQSPNIHKVGSDKLLITYIQVKDDKNDLLVLRTFDDGKLSIPLTIANGDNWFVNWADIPSIVSLDKSGNNLMTHWLQMSAEGTYDYDIRCAISKDGGSSWDSSFVLHDDNIAAEHGFVSMTSTPQGAFATWLDGRQTKTKDVSIKVNENNDHNDDHGHGTNMPMTIRSAWFDTTGNKLNDIEIDNKVCDCCQTDVVYTSSGPVVAYRDRSDLEVRDISIARFIDKKWQHQLVHKDNWTIAGCPVNGPSIAYQDGLLAVAWYTQMNDIPKIFLAISKDDGGSFDKPILIDEGKVMGRVDVVIDENKNIIVTWMESNDELAQVNTRILTNQFHLQEKQKLLDSQNQRKIGFPIIELLDDQIIIARTQTQNDSLAVYLEIFDYL